MKHLADIGFIMIFQNLFSIFFYVSPDELQQHRSAAVAPSLFVPQKCLVHTEGERERNLTVQPHV